MVLLQSERGFGLLITLVALCIVSILGLYLTLNANTGLQISDNCETQIKAAYAALAGINHARALLRGLSLDDMLKGPDGVFDGSVSYLALARKTEFRNPVSLLAAQTVNIASPAPDPGGRDDGLISTGFYGGSNGVALIPATGTGMNVQDPYGHGDVITSRYFVKITDNNGEISETSMDPGDDPFFDGDGLIIVRSVGISRTFSASTGSVLRRNSVVVYETRLKRLSTFDCGPALTILGSEVDILFHGTPEISGGSAPGVGTIDINPADTNLPEAIVRAAVSGGESITGAGRPVPSIQEMGSSARMDPDRSLLLDPKYLWSFVHAKAPKIADSYFKGDQYWDSGNSPNAGFYDVNYPWNAPRQNPRITVVDGDLHVAGGFSGGGLLIVTGALYCSGPYSFNGLVLVVGKGSLVADGSGEGVHGGVLVASVINQGGGLVFGTPAISISGISKFVSDRGAAATAIGLLPMSQKSFREIAGIDP